jgi:hypothetical protein
MPTSHSMPRDERLRRLDARNQRCDGHHRTCITQATLRFTLVAIDMSTGEPKTGAVPIVQQACSKHRKAIGERVTYRALKVEEIPARQVSDGERERGIARTQEALDMTGRRFEVDGYTHTVRRARAIPGDFQLTDEEGDHYLLSEVILLEPEDRIRPAEALRVDFSG